MLDDAEKAKAIFVILNVCSFMQWRQLAMATGLKRFKFGLQDYE